MKAQSCYMEWAFWRLLQLAIACNIEQFILIKPFLNKLKTFNYLLGEDPKSLWCDVNKFFKKQQQQQQ